jgi:monoamine oxidase
MRRRKFLKLSIAFTGLNSFLSSCHPKKKIKGSIIGASSNVGHLLRDRNFSLPEKTTKHQIVIIGAGASGLSAAYHLQKAGITDFIVLDLEDQEGGNSRYGKNSVSSYSWGAHYVPTPNNNLTEYLEFLTSAGVIEKFNEEGLPVYAEQYLCFDPEERLYINGRWQEGLIPDFGVPAKEKEQIKQFLKLMDQYRRQRGKDDKEVFAIPIDDSSKDEIFTRLDNITMKDWLVQNGFSSDYLHWYVNYCVRDDFGINYDQASAWIGIHYFASRKGKGVNAEHGDVLTWPEGNGFLINHLSKDIKNKIQLGKLAVNVRLSADNVTVTYFDTKENKVLGVEAEHCIAAVPQFVFSRLFPDQQQMQKVKKYFHYVPWMVANLTVSKLEERSGAPLSWDNVIYNSPSLGYIAATHQLLQQSVPKKNLTYYLPLTQGSVADARKEAHEKNYGQWLDYIIQDLQKIHPNIKDAIEEANILIWGHAMAQPGKGMIHGGVRGELSQSINDQIHFAHTDLAGASIFEEAFYQGLRVAKKIEAKYKQHV